MMTATIDTRPTERTMRLVLDNPQYRSQTRASAADQAVAEGMARRLFRDHPNQRPARNAALVSVIRASHCPHELINAVVHEAVCRGGMYGLELASDLLAELSHLLTEVIDSYFRRDSRRRARDRKLGNPTYGVADESWGVLLEALASTDPDAVPTADVMATLRRVERSATDGMQEALAVAAARLARRDPTARAAAEKFLRRLLDKSGQTAGSLRIIRDTLSELDD